MARSVPFVLAVLLASVPVAVADIGLHQGPVNVTTTTADSGSACGGASGSHTRDAHANVAIDAKNSFDADAAQYCNDNAWGHGNYTGVSAGRMGPDQGSGPSVTAYWASYRSPGYSYCLTGAYALGLPINLGCPSLDGSGAPLVPFLP